MVLFGVVPIIVSIFVETTSIACRSDMQLMLHNEVDTVTNFFDHVRGLFYAAGWKSSQRIPFDKFQMCMEDHNIELFFNNHNIDTSEAHHIFEELQSQAPSENGVHLDDFALACMHHKRGTKAMEMQKLIVEQSSALKFMMSASDGVKSCEATLSRIVDTLTSQFTIVRHELEEVKNKRGR